MNHRLLAIAALSLSLVACGGGGDSTPAVAPASTTYPLASAYRTYSLTPVSLTFAITGTCTGTATQTVSVQSTAASFEGKPATSELAVLQLSLVGCTPATSADTSTGYFDASTGLPLGYVYTGSYYVTTAVTALPATVKVGDTGQVVTLARYADSTKAAVTGTETSSYVITANDATSAKATLITKIVSSTGVTELTQQTAYRLGTDGSVSVLSIDVQYSTGVHLVLTR